MIKVNLYKKQRKKNPKSWVNKKSLHIPYHHASGYANFCHGFILLRAFWVFFSIILTLTAIVSVCDTINLAALLPSTRMFLVKTTTTKKPMNLVSWNKWQYACMKCIFFNPQKYSEDYFLDISFSIAYMLTMCKCGVCTCSELTLWIEWFCMWSILDCSGCCCQCHDDHRGFSGSLFGKEANLCSLNYNCILWAPNATALLSLFTKPGAELWIRIFPFGPFPRWQKGVHFVCPSVLVIVTNRLNLLRKCCFSQSTDCLHFKRYFWSKQGV